MRKRIPTITKHIRNWPDGHPWMSQCAFCDRKALHRFDFGSMNIANVCLFHYKAIRKVTKTLHFETT